MTFDVVRRDAEASRARTRRAWVASFIFHTLLMCYLVLFASRSSGPPTITEVTWLDAKDLEPPKTPPAPEIAKPAPPAPKPAPVVAAAPKPVAKPQPSKPAPEPVRPAGKATMQDKPGDSGIARAPAPAHGEKGRAAGARVASEVAQTAASIDNVLSSLGTMPVAKGAGGGDGSRRVNDRFAVAGGRGDGALPTSEGSLRGTGLGEVGAAGGAGGGHGAGRGVQKTNVAISDQGVETAGDGAGAAGRDSRSLMAVVQRYVAGVKFCYDNALKKTPQLSGKITLQMDITAPGEVTNLDPLDDSMGNAALEHCILSQVEGWKFPAIPAGTVRFTLPLVFTPPQGVVP